MCCLKEEEVTMCCLSKVASLVVGAVCCGCCVLWVLCFVAGTTQDVTMCCLSKVASLVVGTVLWVLCALGTVFCCGYNTRCDFWELWLRDGGVAQY